MNRKAQRILRIRLCLPGLMALACGARGEPPPLPAVTAVPPPPADTLVLSVPGGTTVWLTESRQGKDSAGTTCWERTVEIRRDTARIKVPLLYTLSAPVLVNDSTFRADLVKDCRPMAQYRVSLTTGRPEKVPQ